ncbi:MAG TPA: DUF3850 domain-containing protein [Candidatus Nanoarchaeia archaeon]|nr:DUF3850 domain-containing protein [Candidatus Nanoarchaeia archaeon]
MRKVEKKWWPETFDQFSSGKRKLELRLNDFDLEVGDIVLAREWDPEIKEYTGRVKEFKVMRVEPSVKNPLKFWPVKEIQAKGFKIIEFE